MRQSKAEIYLHLIWATLNREAFVTPEIERPVYRCIEQAARRERCDMLAIGGMPDHVHICVKIPTTLTVSKLMNLIKGISSHFVRAQFPEETPFQWQEGYGTFSIGRNQVGAIITYIENQKQHHRDGTLQSRWEETDEVYQPKPRASV
jgi:putative transposase